MQKVDKEAEYMRKRMIRLAKEQEKRSKCPFCSNTERKVAVLHEFGDPYIPSSIYFHCQKCGKQEPFMIRAIEDAKRYAEFIMNQDKKLEEGQKTDAMINDMIKQASKKKVTDKQLKEEEAKTIKDDNDEIIASKDKVNDIDSKK